MRMETVAIQAYEELQTTGQVGTATYELLLKLAKQVVRWNSFPPPDGSSKWGDDEVLSLVHDLLAHKKKKFLLGILTGPTNQTSLENYIRKSVKNTLIDEAKKTERGKLRGRLGTLLPRDGRFIDVSTPAGPSWALLGQAQELSSSGYDELVASAANVRGVFLNLPLNPAGRTSKRNTYALVTVSHGVILVAKGSVRAELLARTLEARFIGLGQPQECALSAETVENTPITFEESQQGFDTGTAVLANQIWEQMSRDEHLLLSALGDTGASQARVLGCGARQAKAIAERLVETIRRATMNDDEQAPVVIKLRQMSLDYRACLNANTSSDKGASDTQGVVANEVGRSHDL